MANTDDYTIPENKSWTDPCPGSVTSNTNLDAVTAQITENNNAFLEKRPARALGIPCQFCGNYHLEAQPSVESLIGGKFNTSEWIRHNRTPPVGENEDSEIPPIIPPESVISDAEETDTETTQSNTDT